MEKGLDFQGERTQRAQNGLADGSITIKSTEPDQWVVQNGDHEPYKVVLTEVGKWFCTCMDFSRNRRTGLRCKHIEAVRLSAKQTTRSTSSEKTHYDKEERKNMEQENSSNGWVKLYHPVAGGVQCTLPLPMVALSLEQAKGMFDSLNRLLEAGFVTTQIGLEDGETKEAVTHIARRMKTNTDSSSTPIVDVYCNGNFKVLGIYLNTLDDIDAFNNTFGIGLNSIPLWEGDSSIERGKSADRDKKYIVAVSGVDVVYKKNPKWEGDEDKKHSKRMFVRWEVKAPKAQTQPAASALQAPPAPPVLAEQKPVSGRMYLDGAPVSDNDAEIKAFDAFVSKAGNYPASLQELRSSWAG